jgi:hypothetical protein
MLYCKSCKYGLKNIYDKCKNRDCSLYLQNITNVNLENNAIEKYIFEEYIFEEDILEEDNLKEYNSEKNISEEDNTEYNIHEYLHNGDCIFNEYGQCKKGWRYFCSCGYGIEGYYSQCKSKNCSRNKITKKDTDTKKHKLWY